MIKNFITIAYRNLFRHKIFSFINIFGLALGIASSLLLLQYVGYELSYDSFHFNAANIYRVKHEAYKNGSLEFTEALNYSGVAPAIRESFPEVQHVVRMHRADGMVNYQNGRGEVISYHEKRAFYVDSSFFSIFSFPLVTGDPRGMLRLPGSLLVSESTARKYFGAENPIGKTISLTTEWAGGQYTVEGVFKDVPENSQMKFDFLFGIERLLNNDQFRNGAWYWTNFYTYLLLKPGGDPILLEQKFPGIIDMHLGKELKKMNRMEVLRLQPMLDVHLHSNIGGELEVNGDYKMVSFLLIISFLIIGIAWLNYINLSTAKATERAREVGIRKVMGSGRGLLIKQFLLESSLMTILSLIIASVLYVALIPQFYGLIGKEVAMRVSTQVSFWLTAIGVIVAGTFLSGLYPAFIISSFQPLTVLKGSLLRGVSGAQLRRGLVVFQFCAALLLIIGTITVYRQLAFMRAQDLGMNLLQKVVVRAPRLIKGDSYMNAMDYFKERLKANSKVISAAASSEVPGKEIFWGNHIRMRNEPEESEKPINIIAVDEDFISTYEMKLLAGRNFSKERAGDFGGTAILNQSALRLLGIKSPEAAIDQEVVIANGLPVKIIGVIKDFHQQSLQSSVNQIVLQFMPWNNDYVTLSIAGGNPKEAIGAIEAVYHNVFPENAFTYFFLDDQFNRQYQSEERSWRIFVLFSMLSIVVASMGLFGLASFLTIQRSKEIAIRKVVGASVSAITLMLSKDFIRLVLVSFVFAIPLSWFLMDRWLSGYAYRVNLAWWTFASAAVATLLMAVFTVGFHSIKAAMRNPVNAIKVE